MMIALNTTSFRAEIARIAAEPALYSAVNTCKTFANSSTDKSRRRSPVGIGRPIRADIVRAALRAAGVENATILPLNVTAK